MAKRKRTNSASDEVVPVETTQFLDLNDDCLLDIFSFLPTSALSAVKETCKRFLKPAEDEFKARYRDQPFIFGPEFQDFDDRADFSGALKTVHHFGKFIRVLSVHNIIDERDLYLWRHIFHGCAALKELKISGCMRIESDH